MYSNAYVWSRVLSYLEQHSPAIAIASYFDDAEVIELTESKLVIYSPSPFRKDVIVKRYIDQIREAMRAYQAEKGADGIVLCLTDIMEEGSQVLLEGDTAAAQKGLEIEDVAEGVWMPGVLSRKKQVAAPILAAN